MARYLISIYSARTWPSSSGSSKDGANYEFVTLPASSPYLQELQVNVPIPDNLKSPDSLCPSARWNLISSITSPCSFPSRTKQSTFGTQATGSEHCYQQMRVWKSGSTGACPHSLSTNLDQLSRIRIYSPSNMHMSGVYSPQLYEILYPFLGVGLVTHVYSVRLRVHPLSLWCPRAPQSLNY